MNHYHIEILALLKSHGRMSARELANQTQRPPAGIKGSISLLRHRELIHISAWVRKPDGERGSPHPLFSIGGAPDAPKLAPLGKREYQRRYHLRKKLPNVHISYEDLGIWRGLW